MPVPDFDHNRALPPHLGDPTDPARLSPYPATPLEVCEKLGISTERRNILEGWLSLRGTLRLLGFSDGFQWLDGSFTEDVELLRGMPPDDIDVVTFATLPILPTPLVAGTPAAVIASRAATKAVFHVDHMYVGLNWDGLSIVEHSRYWCGLFSHSRIDGVWKGMLNVELNTPDADAAAVKFLEDAEDKV
jgi:hypothetical protein